MYVLYLIQYCPWHSLLDTEKNHSHILIQNDDAGKREVWHNIIQSGGGQYPRGLQPIVDPPTHLPSHYNHQSCQGHLRLKSFLDTLSTFGHERICCMVKDTRILSLQTQSNPHHIEMPLFDCLLRADQIQMFSSWSLKIWEHFFYCRFSPLFVPEYWLLQLVSFESPIWI